MNKPLTAALLLVLAACSKNSSTPSAESAPAAAAPTVATAPANVALPAGDYVLDKAHSSLIFRVDHLGFSMYTGRFKTFDAQLKFDPNTPANSAVVVTVDPHSLDVENPPAGFVIELLGKDWLDAQQFPELSFRSTSIDASTPGSWKIAGELTLHGQTKPIVMEATLNGGYAGHPMDPHARIGFSGRSTFKRSDFGIAAGIPAPGTKMGVGDEVQVIIETEWSGPSWTPPAADAKTE